MHRALSLVANSYAYLHRYTFENPFAKSILGRIALCATFETIGAMSGAYIGSSLIECGMHKIKEQVLPTACLAMTAYGLRKKTALTALAILGVSATVTAFPFAYGALSTWSAQASVHLGTWVGKSVGTILGGYGALKWANCEIPLWKRESQTDPYAVGMTRYILAEEIFEAVINQSTIPYLSVPLNGMRSLGATLIKSAAYHVNSLRLTLKRALQERSLSQEIWLPLFIKTTCQKYTALNGVPIAHKLTEILSQGLRPTHLAANTFASLLKKIKAQEQVRQLLQSLSAKSDRLTTLLMRAFNEYTALIPWGITDPKELEGKLKNKIPNASALSCVISPFCKTSIDELATSLLTTVQKAEKELIGYTISPPSQNRDSLLAIHLHYFLIYAILNYNMAPLRAEEEKLFFQQLAKSLFALYQEPSFPHGLARCIGKIVQISLTGFFQMKKWMFQVVHPEETALLLDELKFTEDVFSVPKKAEEIKEDFEMIEFTDKKDSAETNSG